MAQRLGGDAEPAHHDAPGAGGGLDDRGTIAQRDAHREHGARPAAGLERQEGVDDRELGVEAAGERALRTDRDHLGAGQRRSARGEPEQLAERAPGDRATRRRDGEEHGAALDMGAEPGRALGAEPGRRAVEHHGVAGAQARGELAAAGQDHLGGGEHRPQRCRAIAVGGGSEDQDARRGGRDAAAVAALDEHGGLRAHPPRRGWTGVARDASKTSRPFPAA